ncbi:MAG: hypothetical protein NT027_14810 [Proteobacteria bacterium]|nr:hypothetical protein [Pseudomonadota bacterium]
MFKRILLAGSFSLVSNLAAAQCLVLYTGNSEYSTTSSPFSFEQCLQLSKTSTAKYVFIIKGPGFKEVNSLYKGEVKGTSVLSD